MIHGFVFDLDGVIINSFELQKKALRYSYEIVGGTGVVSEEEFFRHSGNSLENIFRLMNLPQEMTSHYRKFSSENISCIQIYDGIVDLLEYLKEQNIICGVCTGKERKRTIDILKQFDLIKYFPYVVCSDDVECAKPAPDSLICIAQMMDIDFDDLVMVGDAANDILCAKNAGVKSIGVTWGEFSREELEQAKPDWVVDSFLEIKNIFDEQMLK